MSRKVTAKAEKGSQKDIRILFGVETNRCLLQKKLRLSIPADGWISPITSDSFAEYSDKEFLKQIGLGSHVDELLDFWPKSGPVWDGLARAADGTILLFEAKAHISELFGSGMKAKDNRSRDKIIDSLKETAEYIGADFDEHAWTDAMYQTANRLAFAYFLNKILGVRAKIVYLIFLGDKSVASRDESQDLWENAINIAETYILRLKKRGAKFSDGNSGSWKDWVSTVFIDVSEMSLR